MWKLLLVATVLGCALASNHGQHHERDVSLQTLATNLTRLWERVRYMQHHGGCRSQVRFVTDGGRGHPGGHHGDSHEDGHHDEPGADSESGSAETHGHRDDAEVHLHVHMGGDMSSGAMHGFPGLPKEVLNKYVHATCQFQGHLEGTIEMRQRIGGGPLQMDFDVSGFPTDMANHHHAFAVHWNGKSTNGCDLGNVFTPPKNDRQRYWSDDHSSAEEEGSHGHGSHSGHSGHASGGVRKPSWKEGDLGTVSCNANGVLSGHEEYRQVSILGLHSILGRGLMIHETDSMDSPPVCCCTITSNNGAYWGEADQW